MFVSLRSVACAFVLVACGGAEACPDGSDAEQQEGAQIVASQCVNCHSSKLTGAARSGAPEGYDFDDPTVVRSKATEMFSAVESGRMPKTRPLQAAQVDAVRVYLDCQVSP